MEKQLFINLAVTDLIRSSAFYASMGFEKNPQFSDEMAHCMVWSEHIYVMLLTHEKFKTFTAKTIADTQSQIAGLFSLSVGSNDEVDRILEQGKSGGGLEPHEPRDYGFMYQRSLEDFDGHTWEIFCMDKSKFPQE
jgi:uncharacterized protein